MGFCFSSDLAFSLFNLRPSTITFTTLRVPIGALPQRIFSLSCPSLLNHFIGYAYALSRRLSLSLATTHLSDRFYRKQIVTLSVQILHIDHSKTLVGSHREPYAVACHPTAAQRP